jgi:hypothetical protein
MTTLLVLLLLRFAPVHIVIDGDPPPYRTPVTPPSAASAAQH